MGTYTHRDPRLTEPGQWEPPELYCPRCGERLRVEQTKVEQCDGFTIRRRYKTCPRLDCSFRTSTKELVSR